MRTRKFFGPASAVQFSGEAAAEQEGVVIGRDIVVAAAADDLKFVTFVETERGGIGTAHFEDGLFGGESVRPTQRAFEKIGSCAVAPGIRTHRKIQDFDFAGNVTSNEKAYEFAVFFKNPAGHFTLSDALIVRGFPLGDFGAGRLDGEDGFEIAGFKSADGQRSYFPFNCSSASERRT